MQTPQQQQANYAMQQQPSGMMMQQQPSGMMGNNSRAKIIDNILRNLEYEKNS